MTEVTIRISIADTELEVTPKQAEQVYEQLHNIFGKPTLKLQGIELPDWANNPDAEIESNKGE